MASVSPDPVGRRRLFEADRGGVELRTCSDEEVKFHGSCSQPLGVGNQFGALQIFGLDTTGGGVVSLGRDVEYTYTVSNPNSGTLDNISVEDDKLGTIASGFSLAAGESTVFTQKVLIEEETTNVVTVNGDMGGGARARSDLHRPGTARTSRVHGPDRDGRDGRGRRERHPRLGGLRSDRPRQ